MKIKEIKKNLINLICATLWISPLYFFIRDFFNIDSVHELTSDTWSIIWFSIELGLLTALFSFLIAIVPAYYASYKENFLTKFINGLIFIPFFFPVVSVVTVFSILFNLDFFKNLDILYTLKAILIANVFYNSPIFVKYISTSLKKIPKDIIEAMKLSGASDIKIFLRGQLPLILPQIFRAFILVFTYGLLSFAIVLALGGIRYDTIEVEIATSLISGGNFSRAMMLGGIQVVILISVNILGFFIPEYEIEGNNKNKKLNPFFIIYSIIYVIIEYGVVAFSFIYSFIDIFTKEITINAYKRLFTEPITSQYHILNSIRNSFEISAIVSIIVVILVYIVIKNYNPLTNIVIFANMGISGAFLAITLYYMNILFDIPLFLLLGVGYIIASMPIVYSFMYQYVKKFPQQILDSGEIDCKNSFQIFRYIEFPMLKNIFLSTFFQIFAIIFGEFTISYTMQIEEYFPIVSLTNYSLLSDKLYMESSALTTIVILIIIIFFILGEIIKNRD